MAPPIHKVDIAGQAGGWFDETSTASGWFYRELEDQVGPADETPGGACMSLDVCVEGCAQTVEYYATDDIQGTQCAPLEEAPPEATIVNTAVPDYLVDEMFEPGEFWFQTGPPTSLDDETGQTRGDTQVPEYLDPDDELDPSDQDWQQPSTLNDAQCTFPMLKGNARSTTASGTTHTATLPEYAAGDGVLILVATSAVEILTYPAGWYVIFDVDSTALTTNLTISAIWRVMDGTEGASIDITSASAATLTFQALSFNQMDPYTGPVGVTDVATSANDNPPALTPGFPSTKTMWVAVDFGPDNTHSIAQGPVNYRTFGLFGFPSGGAAQYAMAALRQLDAATDDPGVFNGAITSSATATIAIRGLCLDDANTDPAGCSVPSDLEPEAEVDCYGWQSQGPGDDPFIVTDDPDTGHTSVPDWLEPDAEPNPDDVTFGWQRQSFIEDEHGPAGWWTAVTEPEEDVFEYSTDWWTQAATIDEPALDVDDETTISTCWPDDLEPEAEPLQDGWQQSTRIDIEQCAYPDIVASRFSFSSFAESDMPLPSGVVPGEMLLALVAANSGTGGFTWPAGWTEIFFEPLGTIELGAAYRIADGTEGPSVFANMATRTAWIGVVHRIAGAATDVAPEQSTPGSTANPPSLTASWAADKSLFVAYYAQTVPTVVTTAPSGINRQFDAENFDTFPFGGDDMQLAYAAHQVFAATYDFATFNTIGSPASDMSIVVAIKGACLFDPPASVATPDYLNDPAEDEPTPEGWVQWPYDNEPGASFDTVNTSIPVDLEPEAEVDTEGWRCAPLQDTPTEDGINGRCTPDDMDVEDEPLQDGWLCEPLHDFPENDDINNRSVPDDLEPEAEADTFGWASAPLHDTPSTDDITDTAVPVDLEPEAEVNSDGWAFRLPDMDAPPPEPPPPESSTGTLPGHVARKRWWIEKASKDERVKRSRGRSWPDLPEPKSAPPFRPKTVVDRASRPRLSEIEREWKLKMRRARAAEDAIVAAILTAIIAESKDDDAD